MKKVVLVTGGGRGIGAATAKLLASQGYSVCINYRQLAESAAEVVAAIVAAGGQALAIQADVSDESQVVSLFDETERRLGRITHLVNNAGALFTQSRLVDIDLERFNKVMLAKLAERVLAAAQSCVTLIVRQGKHKQAALKNEIELIKGGVRVTCMKNNLLKLQENHHHTLTGRARGAACLVLN